MDDEPDTKGKVIKHVYLNPNKSLIVKRLEEKVNLRRTVALEGILDLYRDQAQHHADMRDLLTQQKKEDSFHGFYEIFGKLPPQALLLLNSATNTQKELDIPEGYSSEKKGNDDSLLAAAVKATLSTETEIPEGYISIKKAIKERIKTYKDNATFFTEMVSEIEEELCLKRYSVLTLVAQTYYAAVRNSYGVSRALQMEGNTLREHNFLETEIEYYYKIKILRDKLLLYKRIQKKILENFSLDINKLYDELAESASLSLDLELTLPKDEKLLPETVKFCEDLKSRKYRFPALESINDPTITIDESEEDEEWLPVLKSKKKKKTRKKHNRRGAEKRQDLHPQKKNSEPSIPLPEVKAPEGVTSPSQDARVPEVPEPLEKTKKKRKHRKRKPQTKAIAGTEQITPSFPLPETKGSEGMNSPILEEKTSLQNGEVSPPVQANDESVPLNSDQEVDPKVKQQFEEDRRAKKEQKSQKTKKSVSKISHEKEKEKETETRSIINSRNYEFLGRILASPIDLKLRWSRIITLFTSPSGFKGKVRGTKNGAAHTFEVFMRFKNGQLTGFLTEDEFNLLKKDAEAELQEKRKYLRDNKRLECHKINPQESIARTFFSLHNPHPNPCAYRELVERLQKQLALINITPETIKNLGS